MNAKSIIIFIGFIFLTTTCDEPNESKGDDNEPPTVSIISPQNRSIVSEIVTITCISIDNEEVGMVELWVDDSTTGITDNTDPYSLEWNTITYEDGEYSIFIRSYDNSGNTSDSDLITLVVFNSGFVKTFGGSEYDSGISVQLTTDGGYIITGNTRSFGNGLSDLWLIKIDSNGNEEWNQTYGGGDFDIGYCVQQTTDSGYIITGHTLSFGNGNGDVWLVKTDSNGNEEWNQTFGGSSWDYGFSVQQTTDGGYIIICSTESFGDGDNRKAWLIKTDSQGIEEWNQLFSGTSHSSSGKSVLQTIDDGYIISGYFKNLNSYDLFLIKTDFEGNEEWSNVDYPEGYGSGYLQQTSDGGYIITGSLRVSDSDDDIDTWLMKTDSNGNIEWNQTFGGTGYDYGRSAHQTTDGGYVLTGNSHSFGDNDDDIWLIKTNSGGNEEWIQTFGGSSSERGNSVQQTIDGGYIITGSTYSFGNGDYDVWLIKTDSEGNTVPYGE